MIPVFDQLNNADTTQLRTEQGLHPHEVAEFREWRDNQIRTATLNEAQARVSAETVALEAEADAAALKVLAAKGVTMKDCFGANSTLRGRNVAQILHQSDRGKSESSKTFVRLRRIAARQGLVAH